MKMAGAVRTGGKGSMRRFYSFSLNLYYEHVPSGFSRDTFCGKDYNVAEVLVKVHAREYAINVLIT